MVEISKKYKIGKRRFGLINWYGTWTLYKKEVLRFLIVWIQTIFSPLISSLLFLLVLSLAIGADRGDVLGVPFIAFLAPGLISMQVIQQSFSHSSSSFMIKKIDGTIVDLLCSLICWRSYHLSFISSCNKKCINRNSFDYCVQINYRY